MTIWLPDIGTQSSDPLSMQTSYHIWSKSLYFHRHESWDIDEISHVEVPDAEVIGMTVAEDTWGIVSWIPPQPDSEVRVLARLDYHRGKLSVSTHAEEYDDAETVMLMLRKALPPAERSVGEQIAVTFWTLDSQGDPTSVRRLIAGAEWEKMASNYHGKTHRDLDKLFTITPDTSAGKLILWHGDPGTGKTHAIRALARHWRKFAAAHYIVDPENFFGSSPTYMMRVILGEDEWYPHDSPTAEYEVEGPVDQWRLLLMEDTGELLAKDAKQQAGQGLSRLLNVCDGLIGQGLRVMVLITTNEDLGTLHPAVVRPGRCLANVKFSPLTKPEIAQWALENHVENPGSSGLLADLYSPDHHDSGNGVGFKLPAGLAMRGDE